MSVSHRDLTSSTLLRSDADAKSQYLNSVIGSIGSKGQPRPQQPAQGFQSRNDSGGDHLATGRDGSSKMGANPTPPSQKRKAEEDLPRTNEKVVRTTGYRGTSAMLSPYTTSQGAQQVKKSPNLQSNPAKQTLPNRSATNTPKSPTTVTAAPKAAQDPAKAPKKGSFAEIMARAKANKEAPQAVGVIKHQAKDKNALSNKKELLLQKKGKLGKANSRAPNGHSRNSSGDMSSGSASKLPGKNGTGTGKKVPQVAYRGTAQKPVIPRPQPTYRGTMGLGTPAAASGPKKPPNRTQNGRDIGSRRQQEYYSEEEEESEMEEEDEGGYSEESDMEAGFDDVEIEETTATKLARKEDDEEARMEAELKRQKEARKKRLQELAKKQGAKAPRY